jgi:hypothetical protein
MAGAAKVATPTAPTTASIRPIDLAAPYRLWRENARENIKLEPSRSCAASRAGLWMIMARRTIEFNAASGS